MDTTPKTQAPGKPVAGDLAQTSVHTLLSNPPRADSTDGLLTRGAAEVAGAIRDLALAIAERQTSGDGLDPEITRLSSFTARALGAAATAGLGRDPALTRDDCLRSAILYVSAGDHPAAEALIGRALAIRRNACLPDDPLDDLVADLLAPAESGNVLCGMIEHYKALAAIDTAQNAPDDVPNPAVARGLAGLALAIRALSEPKNAKAAIKYAARAREDLRAGGYDRMDVALQAIGLIALAGGDPDITPS